MTHSLDNTKTSLTYADAGVSIDKGNSLVERIKPLAKATMREGVLGGLGGFGALFEIPKGYESPVLVSGTDGVGTKLKLAMDMNKHDTIGIDLVAMCVNDLIVCGAEPLFFLDYYATGGLNIDTAANVVSGIAQGCTLSECALTGGETAEMPGMYQGEDYDLAGFCVGVVEKSKIITGQNIRAGDKLIALGSSGPHSNGYSLIRKIIDISDASLNDAFGDSTLGETLLTPTRIYVKTIKQLLNSITIKGISHITGGGLTENLPRVMPKNSQANINTASWEFPPIFEWLQQKGNIAEEEMYITFNCGVGLILIVSPEDEQATLDALSDLAENAWCIGEITASDNEKPHVAYV